MLNVLDLLDLTCIISTMENTHNEFHKAGWGFRSGAQSVCVTCGVCPAYLLDMSCLFAGFVALDLPHGVSLWGEFSARTVEEMADDGQGRRST